MSKDNLFITPIFMVIAILTISSMIFVNSIDYFMYNGVLNSSLGLVYFFNIIIGHLLQKRKLYKLAPIILIIVMTLLFWINRPNFTYKQAIEIIKNEKKTEYINMGSNIKIFKSPTVYINKAYVINMKKDGQLVKYIFNPINGEYRIFD